LSGIVGSTDKRHFARSGSPGNIVYMSPFLGRPALRCRRFACSWAAIDCSCAALTMQCT
jgi:hypothetical protein